MLGAVGMVRVRGLQRVVVSQRFTGDGPRRGWRGRLRRSLLAVDSRVDFGLFKSTIWGRELFERFAEFMDKFHVGGWRRWVLVEPISELGNIGLGGLVLALALAMPAFRETSDEDWLKKSDLAVVFLDRYGVEVGSRGIKHNDSIPLEQLPDRSEEHTSELQSHSF